MPNGISCAFFAGKNLIYGQKEKNVFKEGIAAAQTARTIDSVAQAGVSIPHAKEFGVLAKLGKKIVYPLVILSGIYNTIKSKDKIKTGSEQALGIGTMCGSEIIAENYLKKLETFLLNTNPVKNNKKLKTAVYIAKGAAFICASLLGYTIGSKTADKAVCLIRNKKNQKFQKDNADMIFKEMIL